MCSRCVYDDIFLAIRQLRRASGGAVKTVMVVDLDVHQGNGEEWSCAVCSHRPVGRAATQVGTEVGMSYGS